MNAATLNAELKASHLSAHRSSLRRLSFFEVAGAKMSAQETE
jgi:hypothetical protein